MLYNRYGSADSMERQANRLPSLPSVTIRTRPSFASGSADSMERQINQKLRQGWRPLVSAPGPAIRPQTWQPVRPSNTAAGGGSWMNARPAVGAPPTYRGVLPGLSAEEEFYFNDMISQAALAQQRANDMSAEELQRLGLWVNQRDNALQREGYQAGTALRERLSEGGLGFSPMFLNRGMREIAGQVAAGRADVAAQRAAREEALRRMVQDAELSYGQIRSRAEAEKAMRRSQIERGLLGGMR